MFDMDVDADQVYGFLGPNGAGKTTLIRLIIGLLLQEHGTITVLGMDSVRTPGYFRKS